MDKLEPALRIKKTLDLWRAKYFFARLGGAALECAGLALWLSETGRLALGWSWIVVIGTVLTFALGWLLGPVLDKPQIKTPQP